MEFKGTKGKWVLKTFIEGQMSVRNEDDTRKICVSRVNNHEESLHNLLLISTAPEMLSMLNRIYTKKTVTFDDLLKIKELINKATEL